MANFRYYIGKLRRIRDWRHLKICVQSMFSICSEKIQGIDFSVIEPISNIPPSVEVKELASYIFTSKDVIESALDHIEIASDSAFLDVGCGKGLVLYRASKRNFKRIAGVELDRRFAEIAVNNFRKLRLDKRVEIFNCDARLFERYGEFDVFYFFNPFSIEIQEDVIKKIVLQRKLSSREGRTTWLICYHDSAAEYIKATGLFDCVTQYKEEERGHTIYIWKSIRNKST